MLQQMPNISEIVNNSGCFRISIFSNLLETQSDKRFCGRAILRNISDKFAMWMIARRSYSWLNNNDSDVRLNIFFTKMTTSVDLWLEWPSVEPYTVWIVSDLNFGNVRTNSCWGFSESLGAVLSNAASSSLEVFRLNSIHRPFAILLGSRKLGERLEFSLNLNLSCVCATPSMQPNKIWRNCRIYQMLRNVGKHKSFQITFNAFGEGVYLVVSRNVTWLTFPVSHIKAVPHWFHVEVYYRWLIFVEIIFRCQHCCDDAAPAKEDIGDNQRHLLNWPPWSARLSGFLLCIAVCPY